MKEKENTFNPLKSLDIFHPDIYNYYFSMHFYVFSKPSITLLIATKKVRR